jgi:RNA polymerase sigma factor (sigma-70 family)
VVGAEHPAGAVPPHRDAARFDQVVESVGPASILVLIDRWMGERLRSQCSAEDLWQETLVHAWVDRDQHEWQDVKVYKGWLLGIARNRIHEAVARLDAKKRGGEEQTATFSTLVNSAAGSQGGRLSALLPAGSSTPSRIASHREAATLMRQALESVPEELQAVIQLYLFEELPMERVAAQLGIPTSTAWYRFKKGSAEYASRLAGLRSRSAGS